MARELRKQWVADAVKAYAAKTGKTTMLNDSGDIILLPGDIIVKCESGKLECSDVDTKFALSEILMEMPQEPTKSPNLPAKANGHITSRSQAGNVLGSALDAVRGCQATEKATYSTGGKRMAASAKTNIAALMEAGGSLEILSMTCQMDFIEYKVRAHLGEQYVDSSMAFHRMQYLAKKAWDWIPKYAVADPTLITGTDDNLLPIFKEGAVIKCRITDDGNSLLVPLPAPVAMFKELAREWQSAGRVCETKAYNRASDMILRQSFQGREEMAEEQSEVDAITISKEGKA
jgi:hypothetical protein